MSNHNEISSFIWDVCDDVLRNKFEENEYGSVILPFTVLRRLDCLLESQKDDVIGIYNETTESGIEDPSPIIFRKTGFKFYNHSKYDLVRLKSDPNNLKLNINNYLNGFSENVFEILKYYEIEKIIEKLQRNKILYSLIDKFSEVNLHPDVVDNRSMGLIYEELLRRYSEKSNKFSGDHYTPRDIVKLLVSLVFTGEENVLDKEGTIRSIYDPCCGTGGMLTIGKEWVQKNLTDKVKFQLYGQESLELTYSMCKSDFLIINEEPDRIRHGSSLSEDRFEGNLFDYMITNPPFGVSWKEEKSFIEEESKNPLGRFSVGTPRTSDGSLLFLQHMISKMKPEGSRIGVVFNGSPLFTGDSGSGESEIRKWIIENDWLECIVSLPDQMFFGTGITTYLWIVTNKKKSQRKGKVQLINGSTFYKPMKKSLGSKRKELSSDQTESLIQSYKNFEENEFSKIFDNEFFGYTKITIEQPKIENGEIVRDKKGNPKPDSKLRDSERVPLSDDIEEYFTREVEPHLPNSWIDFDKSKVGYEINFTKYFYQYKPLRSSNDISNDLLELKKESENLLNLIMD